MMISAQKSLSSWDENFDVILVRVWCYSHALSPRATKKRSELVMHGCNEQYESEGRKSGASKVSSARDEMSGEKWRNKYLRAMSGARFLTVTQH